MSPVKRAKESIEDKQTTRRHLSDKTTGTAEKGPSSDEPMRRAPLIVMNIRKKGLRQPEAMRKHLRLACRPQDFTSRSTKPNHIHTSRML